MKIKVASKYGFCQGVKNALNAAIFELSRNNEKILLGCSSLAFHALFMVLIGVAVLLYIKLRPEKKNDEPFQCRRGCSNG